MHTATVTAEPRFPSPPLAAFKTPEVTPAAPLARSKPKAVKVEVTAEEKFIAACMNYAQAVAATAVAFDADPDGNSKRAEKLIGRMDRKAEALLTEIVAFKADVSPSALSAKARVVAALHQHGGYPGLGGFTSELAIEFYASLARDVRAFTAPLVNPSSAGAR